MKTFGVLICFASFFLSSLTNATVSNEEIVGKIQACLQTENPRSITDYNCPKGDFIHENKRRITDEEIAYLVVMSVRFNDLDKEVLDIMKKLQKNRETNGMSWIEYINTTVTPFGARYQTVCTNIGGDLEAIGLWKKANAQSPTIDPFPQTYCNDLAKKKSKAWDNMGYILASKGIAKGYQNSKDTHLETIKSKYNVLLEKWQWYERIFDTAVTKFTAYVRDPVQ